MLFWWPLLWLLQANGFRIVVEVEVQSMRRRSQNPQSREGVSEVGGISPRPRQGQGTRPVTLRMRLHGRGEVTELLQICAPDDLNLLPLTNCSLLFDISPIHGQTW